MGQFNIVVRESVLKDLRKIPKPFLKNINKKISDLSANPFPASFKKLTGSKGLYRIRSGDYRIIYGVNVKDRLVAIQYIGNRKDIYDKL